MAQGEHLQFVSDIEGASLYDPLGVKIGTVDRLLIDAHTLTVRAMLVRFSMTGIHGRPIGLPRRLIHYDPIAERFWSFVTRSQLATAPIYDEDLRTALSLEQIEAYYNNSKNFK
jgi:hypothetical protein